MSETQAVQIKTALSRFTIWLGRYGETSYDYQSYFASALGRRAKALYYQKPLFGKLAVSPMVFSEAFVPSTRRFFWKRQRFPIADAHYAMGFALLSQILGAESHYERAIHFLEVLIETRCPGFENYACGYPFHCEIRRRSIKEGIALLTTGTSGYQAFRLSYLLHQKPRWPEIRHSLVRPAFANY